MRARRAAAAAVDRAVFGTLGLGVGAIVSRAGPHSVWVALGVAGLVLVGTDTVVHARRGRRAGQSLGKQLLGLRVTPIAGAPDAVPLWRWLARCTLRWPAVALSFGGLFQESVHDRILGTAVARTYEPNGRRVGEQGSPY